MSGTSCHEFVVSEREQLGAEARQPERQQPEQQVPERALNSEGGPAAASL
jgi:hypothetical protein